MFQLCTAAPRTGDELLRSVRHAVGDFVADRRHGYSLAFARPFSPWALDTLVASLVRQVVADGRFDARPLLPASGLGGDQRAVAALQRHRFQDCVQYAAATVPYYRDLFRERGVTTTGATPDGIPVTGKEPLRERADEFVSTASFPFMRVTTTGTTGRPTVVHFSRREWHAIGALAAYSMIGSGLLTPGDLVQIAVTPRAVLPNHAVTTSCAAVGATVHVAGMAHPEQALTLLSRRHRISGGKDRVSVMTANPSYLGHLVEHGLAHGWRPERFGLERIFLGGEVITDGLRRRARELFGGVEIRQSYALTELVPFNGQQCSQGHVHFEPTSGLAEVIDPETGKPAAPGELGTVVATPFRPYRDTTVLLRFDTGDAVRALPVEPDCELRNLFATGPLLGKLSTAVRHDHGWTFTRDVAEALESVDAVPLPARYGFSAAPGGVAVEAAIRPGTDPQVVRGRIGEALEARGVPLGSLSLVDDPAAVRDPVRLRSDFDEGQLLPRHRAVHQAG
jgi:phenylacetate-coenzyme A ligase PaaK-like adenylate-forming protein